MTTYSISPNSHRIDKTVFATKDEAIARALECARVLNRGISVYEVEEPGTNTQEKQFPKITSPITHIAFVLPDGTVRKGQHPAIELLERNPEDGEYKTYPFALGQLSKLVRTLDEIARHPTVSNTVRSSAFTLADSVQNRIFESQKAIKDEKTETTTSSFEVPFRPGTVYANKTPIFVNIIDFNPATKVVSFTSSSSSAAATSTVMSVNASALAKTLLRGDFSPMGAPVQQNMPQTQPSDETKNNWQPETQLNVKVDFAKDGNKEQKSTLTQHLKEMSGNEQPPTLANAEAPLLQYCMSICNNDIYAADELATAFLDAFNPQSKDRRTTAQQLKVMSSFRTHKLPEDWFTTAQRHALKQLSMPKMNFAMVLRPEAAEASTKALKHARDKGIQLPRLTKIIATRIANKQALDFSSMMKLKYFMTTVTSSVNYLEYEAWGGDSARDMITHAFGNTSR